MTPVEQAIDAVHGNILKGLQAENIENIQMPREETVMVRTDQDGICCFGDPPSSAKSQLYLGMTLRTISWWMEFERNKKRKKAWWADTDLWHGGKGKIQAALTAAYMRGDPHCHYTGWQGDTYVVDFVQMSQRNTNTDGVRRICPGSCPAVSA